MKMTFKLFVLIVPCLGISCKTPNPEPEPVPDNKPDTKELLFTASLENILTHDGSLVAEWSENDAVNVYSSGVSSRFRIQTILGATKSKAAFAGKSPVSDSYLALYPYDGNAVFNEEKRLPCTIPDTYDPDSAPSFIYMAESDRFNFHFLNIYSFLSFVVGNDGVAKISISSRSKALCGGALIGWSDGAPAAEVTGDGHVIHISGKFPKGTRVTVPIVPADYPDLSVNFVRGDFTGAEKAAGRTILERGVVKDMGTVELSDWHDVKGSLYLYGPAAETGRKFTYIENDLYYNTENGDYMDYVDKIDGPYYEIFTALKAGAEFWSAESETGQAEHCSVEQDGVYRIRVEASTLKTFITPVKRVTLFKSMKASHTDLYYQGNGKWTAEKYCTKWSKESWGVEERFRFSIFLGDTEQPLGINNPGITGGRPSETTPEEYYEVQPCRLGQWTGAFKYPDSLVDQEDSSKWFADVVLDLSGQDGHYAHAFTNARTLPVEGLGYRNPVFAEFSIPDPDVIRADDGYFYAMGTEHDRTACRNVPVMKSPDLVNWEKAGTLFTDETHPNITDKNPYTGIWAPSINKIGDKYVCYYSQPGDDFKHAIGVATSDRPEGPYTDHGLLISSQEQGIDISIDAYLYQEDGRNYLFWGSFRAISILELTADGLAIKDKATQKRVEVAGGQYEASVVLKRDGYYYLICSTGNYAKGGTYHIVVGRSKNLYGPYVDKDGQDMMSVHHAMVLEGNRTFTSPGHCSRLITDDNGQDWILYHAYMDEYNYRVLMLDRIDWVGGWPAAPYKQATFGDEKPYFKTR